MDDTGPPTEIPLEARVSRLEEDMRDVKAILGRLEPMIVRIDARMPQLATKEEFARTDASMAQLATKEEVARIDASMAQLATKEEVARLDARMAQLATQEELTRIEAWLATELARIDARLTAEIGRIDARLLQLATKEDTAYLRGRVEQLPSTWAMITTVLGADIVLAGLVAAAAKLFGH